MPSIAARNFSGRWFAEAYVDGREFNIAVMAGEDGPRVFPLAEMRFNDSWPDGKPKLVSFAPNGKRTRSTTAAASAASAASADEPALARQLIETTKKVWHLFSLRGYARVDYRVDKDGKPWVLEINPNCCISTDAGFAAAAEEAGISYEQLIGQVAMAALHA